MAEPAAGAGAAPGGAVPAGPAISVIVPAHGAERTVGATVAALRQQTLPPERYEVIVVDDGSPDAGTAEAAARAGARVLRQPHAGPAAARNRGVRAARGELIVFTDADCEPEPDFLERLTAPLFAEPGLGATKGAYLSRQRAPVARLVQLEYESRYDRTRRYQEQYGGIDFIDTYAAAFRRRLFEEAGGFDEAFPDASVEDQELSFRLAALGVRMRFVPQARVWHRHADSWWAYARKKAKIGYWKVAVLRRHPRRALRDSHTPQGLKLEVALAGLFWASLLGAAVAALAGAGAAPLAVPAAALLGLFGLGSPLLVRVGRAEPRLLGVAPLFLLVRASALGAGLAWGLMRRVRLAPPPLPAAALPGDSRPGAAGAPASRGPLRAEAQTP